MIFTSNRVELYYTKKHGKHKDDSNKKGASCAPDLIIDYY